MHYDRTILAYHGCDAEVAARLLAGDPFVTSDNDYDWLGRGVYFWEFGPDRALRWAEQTRERDAKCPPVRRAPVERPAVVGVILKLGHCLDLLDTEATYGLAGFYPRWAKEVEARGDELPKNDPNRRHFLDCAVINAYVALFEFETGRPCDAVRGCFLEGPPIYDGSNIRRETHIQVAVRRPDACVVGAFRPTLRGPP